MPVGNPFKVGDSVAHKTNKTLGTVTAIDGSFVEYRGLGRSYVTGFKNLTLRTKTQRRWRK